MSAQGQMAGASSNQPMLCDFMKSIGLFAHYAMTCNCDAQMVTQRPNTQNIFISAKLFTK